MAIDKIPPQGQGNVDGSDKADKDKIDSSIPQEEPKNNGKTRPDVMQQLKDLQEARDKLGGIVDGRQTGPDVPTGHTDHTDANHVDNHTDHTDNPHSDHSDASPCL